MMPKPEMMEDEAPDETEGADESGSFYIPSGTAGIGDVKEGDTITLTVVSVDEENGIEVKAAGGEAPQKDWKDDLRSSMAQDQSE